MSDINVSNGSNEAQITLSFAGQPVYAFFPLHNPERVVLDIRQSAIVRGLPLDFSGDNIVKRIRASTAKDSQSIRLVFDLTRRGKTRAVTRRDGRYKVVFTITGNQPALAASRSVNASGNVISRAASSPKSPFDEDRVTRVSSGDEVARPRRARSSNDTVIVAIDAGHGGQDPGAVGGGGLKEKRHHCHCPQIKGVAECRPDV